MFPRPRIHTTWATPVIPLTGGRTVHLNLQATQSQLSRLTNNRYSNNTRTQSQVQSSIHMRSSDRDDAAIAAALIALQHLHERRGVGLAGGSVIARPLGVVGRAEAGAALRTLA